jgi:predicted ester cyclase
MSFDQHKAMSRRSLEMWSSDNADTAEAIFADNYVNNQEPYVEGGVRGLDLPAWKDLLRDFHRAFTDCRVDIRMQIAEGELVATRWQMTATNSGPHEGRPPTHERVSWTGVEIDRFAAGKIVESWVDRDKYRMAEQLGWVT